MSPEAKLPRALFPPKDYSFNHFAEKRIIANVKPPAAEGIPEIEKIKGRDSKALADWVQAHHQDVFRFMKHLTRHQETAEDLTQQTFVKAFAALGGFDGRSTMRVWLHAIAFREYAGWRRKHRILAPLEMVRDRGTDEHSRLEERNALLDAVHRLDSKLREAFLLNEIQGLTFEEMATITGQPVGTLKSRAFYAKKQLRASLSIEEFEGDTYEA